MEPTAEMWLAELVAFWEVWRRPATVVGKAASGPGLARPGCPRCGHHRTQRWGRFSGRQRYRCTSCRRTFSTFTGTPIARSRRAHTWIPYLRAMAGRAPLRQAAARAGISVATSFRRRHRLLHWVASRNGAAGPIRGRVHIGEIRIPESFKGSRDLPRPARRWSRPFGQRLRTGRCAILLHLCRHGTSVDDGRSTRLVFAGVFDPSPPRWALPLLLQREVERPQAHARGSTRFSPFPHRPSKAKRIPSPIARCPIASAHLRLARVRFRSWMSGFRGVATRYLPHYAAWLERADAFQLMTPRGDPVGSDSAASALGALAFVARRPGG
jgi:transposase-like protein